MPDKGKDLDEVEDITAIQPEILIEDEQPTIEVQGEITNMYCKLLNNQYFNALLLRNKTIKTMWSIWLQRNVVLDTKIDRK